MTLVGDYCGTVLSRRPSCHACRICRLALIPSNSFVEIHLRPGNFSPHDSNLGTPDLSLCAVDERDLLAQIESADLSGFSRTQFGVRPYLAASVEPTPSICIKLVFGFVLRFAL